MAVASTGTTLELQMSSLRDTRRGSVPCSGRGGWRSRRDIFRAVCLVTGGARPAGCGSGRPGIRGRGGGRRFSGGGAGTPMRCATPCANSPRDAGRRGRDAGSGRDRFSEKGGMSCGVARQYTGSAGRATNCRASSPSASRATATPSLPGGCTCRRRGRTIRRAWPVRMCRTAPGSPPSRPSRFR